LDLLVATGIRCSMPGYRLRYLDAGRKFIRADVIEGLTDEEAIAAAHAKSVNGRSELWQKTRLVAKFRAAGPDRGACDRRS
jgi:hypothetical protein